MAGIGFVFHDAPGYQAAIARLGLVQERLLRGGARRGPHAQKRLPQHRGAGARRSPGTARDHPHLGAKNPDRHVPRAKYTRCRCPQNRVFRGAGPEHQNATAAGTGGLGFSRKNAIPGKELGISSASEAGLTRRTLLALFPFPNHQAYFVIHKSQLPLPMLRVARIVPEFCARTRLVPRATPCAQRNKEFLARGAFCLFNCCTNAVVRRVGSAHQRG